MQINDIDIKAFNAKQISATYDPPDLALNYEILSDTVSPVINEDETNFGALTLTICFYNKNRDEALRQISLFMMHVREPCDICIDNHKGTFRGFLKNVEYIKSASKKKYAIEIIFDGYFFDEKVTHTMTSQEMTINVAGSRKTPCTLQVTPTQDIAEFTIAGFTNTDIVLKDLKAGEEIEFDGSLCIINQNENRDFSKNIFYEFPHLSPGKTTIKISSLLAKVAFEYCPRWL